MELIRAHWSIIVAILAGVILVVGVFRMIDDLRAPEIVIVDPFKDRTIAVQISGAVATPGVYELSANSRVADVLEAAGGTLENADLADINQAARLEDASQVVIPTESKSVILVGTPSAQGLVATDTLLNLNDANQAELEALPGIGPVLAARIIEARDKNGGFASLDELIAIDGISQSTIDKFSSLVTVDQ